MATDKTSNKRPSQGLEIDKPLVVRLTPAERQRLIDMALEDARSMGSLGRIALLKGMEVIKQEKALLANR